MRKSSSSSATLDSLNVMLRQELLAYHPPRMDLDPSAIRFSRVGMESRGRMLSFFYDLCDKIGSSKDTVEIAVSHLDRFLAHPSYGVRALKSKKYFQLASTTCVYVAIKMHEQQAITPSLLADLSHGIFTAADVEDMEVVLAQTLGWRLNPPTSLAFARQYLDLLPKKFVTRSTKRKLYGLARHQMEFALQDAALFSEKKSLVAYVSVQNALVQLNMPVDLCQDTAAGDLLLNYNGSESLQLSIVMAAMSRRLGVAIPACPQTMDTSNHSVVDLTTELAPAPAPATVRLSTSSSRESSPAHVNKKACLRPQFSRSPRCVGNNVA